MRLFYFFFMMFVVALLLLEFSPGHYKEKMEKKNDVLNSYFLENVQSEKGKVLNLLAKYFICMCVVKMCT